MVKSVDYYVVMGDINCCGKSYIISIFLSSIAGSFIVSYPVVGLMFRIEQTPLPTSKCSCNIAIIVIIGPKRVKLRQNTRFATICVNSKWHFVFCASKLWEQNDFFIFTKKDDF